MEFVKLIQSSGNKQSSKRTHHTTSQDGLYQGSKEVSFLCDVLFGHCLVELCKWSPHHHSKLLLKDCIPGLLNLSKKHLCFTRQLDGFWHLVIYHCVNALLVAVCYEAQVEAQSCRWKGLSNSILSKPASCQRRGRHMGLILILLTFHQCISIDFEGITVALLSIQRWKICPWNKTCCSDRNSCFIKLRFLSRFYCNSKDLNQAQQFY